MEQKRLHKNYTIYVLVANSIYLKVRQNSSICKEDETGCLEIWKYRVSKKWRTLRN